MIYKPTITKNILNISKLTVNHLITKKHTMFTTFAKPQVLYGRRTCLMTFNLTQHQLLFLADLDIV